MLITILSIITFVCAVLCALGKHSGNNLQIYIFKPLTTVLIIIIAVIAGSDLTGNYKYLILLALIFSLLGDILLMLPDKFLPGLISFFIAHVIFVYAFFSLGRTFTWWLILIFVLAGVSFYGFLFNYLGKMKIPVFFYVAVLSSMAWRALENVLLLRNTEMFLIAIGAILFVISDANIAINKFSKEYKGAEVVIISTYFIAIWFISISLCFM